MKILILYGILLSLALATLAKECSPPICPKNCEFGTKMVQATKGKKCIECICIPNPCDTNSCPTNTICKVQTPEKYECIPSNDC